MLKGPGRGEGGGPVHGVAAVWSFAPSYPVVALLNRVAPGRLSRGRFLQEPIQGGLWVFRDAEPFFLGAALLRSFALFAA
jgi:hypothetical protein